MPYTQEQQNISVLFVCLGNICRSPSAHAVFEYLLEQKGMGQSIHVDSCGTAAYHIGKSPDPRSRQAAEQRGYPCSHLRARQLADSDFERFDYILAMDEENLSNIQHRAPVDTGAHIALFMDFHSDPSVREVPDPYYGGERGFDKVLDLIEDASAGFFKHLVEQYQLRP